uniref:Lycopene cyclase n=1 Tax=Chlorobium chlorochromatii (strain CaD3) TaxID=340177 RepID=Q3ATY4_CHLCH
MALLESIRQSAPALHRAFASLADGEQHLQRLVELDGYWERLKQPPARVVLPASALPCNAAISGEYDLIYAGGTLSMFHAAVMARRYGHSVMVFDRHTPATSTRDWNISWEELLRLRDVGLFSEAELDSVVVRRYRDGWVEFYQPDGKQKRLTIEHVLDCAVETSTLLGMAKVKLLEVPNAAIFGGYTFQRCYQLPDGVIVEIIDSKGERLFYKCRLLLDVMGILSPIAMQLNEGRPQTHVCPTVGTIASGFEGVDMEVGEILASTRPADVENGTGRQLIWEGFPAKGSEYITYLFFYDSVESANNKSLISLFDTYFRLLPEYKQMGKNFTIHRPVYGIIPAYFHDGVSCKRTIAADNILLLGDAASLSSPLTFCGFGSLVRNLHRLTAGLEQALAANQLSQEQLTTISAWEPNVAAMANLMKYMCFNPETDSPNFVNDLMNEVMIVLDSLPHRYRQAMFRDEMKIEELVEVMLRVAWRYPKVLSATWTKLGVTGSIGFFKNLAGWALGK